jgi:aspartyl/asparaginyl beta-hydroxylase (cupin superfamily)
MTEPLKQPIHERVISKVFLLLMLIGETLIWKTTRSSKQPFFKTDSFEWVPLLEKNWQVIRSELDKVLMERDNIPAFHKISSEQEALGTDNGWKVFIFYVFGHSAQENCDQCPKTSALLKQIPGLRNAMFSILEPQRSIPMHRGPYKGLLRYHLGLKIPRDKGNLSITVKDETQSWSEGKTLILDDSFPHFVTNNSNQERVILFADFIRPLPWPISSYNHFIISLLKLSPLAKKALTRIKENKIHVEPK